jgi:hypothetical protein
VKERIARAVAASELNFRDLKTIHYRIETARFTHGSLWSRGNVRTRLKGVADPDA